MSEYKKLRVWRKAHALALNAHRTATRIRGPNYAAFRSQIIRSALSVPANIVEGREQKTEAAFARFLRIAIGSLSELDYHLLAARDLHVIAAGEHIALSDQIAEVRMMLHGLVPRLEGESPSAEPDAQPRQVNRSSADS